MDGCHIRSDCDGVILSANSLDEDGAMVPLGIMLCSIENESNWTFFLQNLRKAIPKINKEDIVIMHDCEKGLQNAQRSALLQSTESICVFHLEKNVLLKFCTKAKGKLGQWQLQRQF